MYETSIYGYYVFGYNYYVLRFSNETISIKGTSDTLIVRIDEFLQSLDDLDLKVTKEAAKDLINIRKRLDRLSESEKVDSSLATEITSAINKLDNTLDAELKLKNAYILTPKRFELTNLLKSPEKILARDVYTIIPNICQFDFRQACLCVAYSLPTAAAFHIMRAIEGALRFYYCTIVKRRRVDKLLWGSIIKHLRQRRDAPPKTILDSLDNIRDNFRNPTQHPDARYDLDEAQDLLYVGSDAINRMVRNLKEKKEI